MKKMREGEEWRRTLDTKTTVHLSLSLFPLSFSLSVSLSRSTSNTHTFTHTQIMHFVKITQARLCSEMINDGAVYDEHPKAREDELI